MGENLTSTYTILAVDDTSANLLLLTKLLKDQGYKVRGVTNGKMALTVVQASPPDLILLDVNMPDMNGYEVCKKLKEQPETASIPVLFISALDDTEDKIKGFSVGGVDYITKPFKFEEVLSRVKTHLELHAKEQLLENLSSKLSKYLSPQVYDSIFSGKKDVKLESYRKELTIFFSDIQGFTSLTDSMESEALTELLNQYLNEMSEIALKYGGTLDKFIGDAIMIFFGDPETKGMQEDALTCARMAIEMRKRMEELRSEWITKGVDVPLHIRIGINTGYCTVGNFGSESRLDYTIIGGQVNLASRLETNAEPDQILISHRTYTLIK
ncbi:MAG: adenylate cyclase, partial [bacterium]